MIIGIHDSELSSGYPNLALMKLSAYHKAKGDMVDFYSDKSFDVVYSSKVFTWTKDASPQGSIKGGTGYGLNGDLSYEIEHLCPDYSLYNCNRSYGFLTRGCPNKCDWCFVPEKEGGIQENADIEEFTKHKEVVLMDNNVLASPFGIFQIEKISKLGLKIDFNQGLDARRIDYSVARLLGKCKWHHPIRLACDTKSQMKHISKAVELLRWHNATPSQYFCYVLVKDIEDALERVKFLKGLYVYPFAQPYRDKENTEPTKRQKAFCRWVNHRAIFRSVTWEDYQYNTEFDDL